MDKEIDQNITRTKLGLRTLDRVFNKGKVKYRVLGSLLVAAINGKPHRRLGDIDILVDRSDADKVMNGLKNEGYELIKKHKIIISWWEAQRLDSLGFTFLLAGTFTEDYFSYHLNNIEVRINNAYLAPTNYSLFGTSFTGIPLRSIYEGLKISNLNPKRAMDKKVLTDKYADKIPAGKTLEESFGVYLGKSELPYAYTAFSHIYNLYGGLRVVLGKKYEIWD